MAAGFFWSLCILWVQNFPSCSCTQVFLVQCSFFVLYCSCNICPGASIAAKGPRCQAGLITEVPGLNKRVNKDAINWDGNEEGGQVWTKQEFICKHRLIEVLVSHPDRDVHRGWKKELKLREVGGLEKRKEWIKSLTCPNEFFWEMYIGRGDSQMIKPEETPTLKKVKVVKLRLTLCDPVDYTDHGILWAKILEWVAVPFSRGSSQPRDRTRVSHIAGGFFTSWATKEAQEVSRRREYFLSYLFGIWKYKHCLVTLIYSNSIK